MRKEHGIADKKSDTPYSASCAGNRPDIGKPINVEVENGFLKNHLGESPDMSTDQNPC